MADSLRGKMIKALQGAVDDGDIYKDVAGEASFDYHGRRNLLQNLLINLSAREASTLFYDWLADGDDEVAKDFLDNLITPSVPLVDNRAKLTNKILNHFRTDVDQMLNHTYAPGPIEAFKAERDM